MVVFRVSFDFNSWMWTESLWYHPNGIVFSLKHALYAFSLSLKDVGMWIFNRLQPVMLLHLLKSRRFPKSLLRWQQHINMDMHASTSLLSTKHWFHIIFIIIWTCSFHIVPHRIVTYLTIFYVYSYSWIILIDGFLHLTHSIARSLSLSLCHTISRSLSHRDQFIVYRWQANTACVRYGFTPSPKIQKS